ncbi:Bug family tripartite tricarboxylate transporter substrate binding protein [Achromobacter aloeverae]
MISSMKRWAAMAALALLSLPIAARAEKFPDKPVRLIVGYAPGGTADVAARAVARELSTLWNESVIVENHPGADGLLAVTAVARSAPDGYTLLSAPSNIWSIFPHMYPKAPANAAHDLAPVGTIGYAPLAIVVNAKAPYRTLREFVDYAKAHPGKLTFGVPGSASVHRMAGEKLSMLVGSKMINVPYKGSAPAVQDLAGGRIDLLYAAFPSVNPLVQAGKVRIIAVTSPTRVAELPDVPSVAEVYPSWGDAFSTYHGIYAPVATPRAVIDAINAALEKAVASKSVREVLSVNGVVPNSGSADEFKRFLDENYKEYDQIFNQLGIKPSE